MRITKIGKLVPFHCTACGCEFVAGINEVAYYSETTRSRCGCPCCGAITRELCRKSKTEEQTETSDEQAAVIDEEMSHGQPSAG